MFRCLYHLRQSMSVYKSTIRGFAFAWFPFCLQMEERLLTREALQLLLQLEGARLLPRIAASAMNSTP